MVLACNNYEVIDLGVMVPGEKIIAIAKERDVDVIGLSGLITPSLDEMVSIAKEMKRQSFSVPLLIGGATTSHPHTSVKIAPEYAHGVVHVLDASRVVNVVSALLSTDAEAGLPHRGRREAGPGPRRLRVTPRATQAAHPRRRAREQADLRLVEGPTSRSPNSSARRASATCRSQTSCPSSIGGPFFNAWELFGAYPAILEDQKVGVEAKKLFADAQTLLAQIIEEKPFTANGVVSFWPCNAVGDDVEIYADEARSQVLARFHMLRQQAEKQPGQANLCLADYLAPKESGRLDYCGGFRGDHRPRCRRLRAGLSREERRLLGDHGAGAR